MNNSNDIICMGINRGCWDAAQTAGLRIHRADAKRLFGDVVINGHPIDWDTVAAIDTQTTDKGFDILCVHTSAETYEQDFKNADKRFDLTTPYFPESLYGD